MPHVHGADAFTVLFAGGGTGGHLMPGLSVAEELARRFPNSRSVFVGTSKALETSLVERRGFEFRSLPSLRWSGPAWNAPQWMFRTTGGLLAAMKLIQHVRPDIVVGLGGHAAFAPGMAGALANIPLVIMEQNALPGKVNRALSWWAREVHVPWAGTEDYFAYPDRVQVTGNPVRRDLDRPPSRRLAARFGLSPRKKTLLVMGGSQGAQALNRVVIESLPRLEAEAQWLQVLHSTGPAGYEEVHAAYARSAVRAAVQPFIEDMSSAYAVSDLALCRAGGTTLAELTTQGVPALLVPLPSSANDHQRRNASRLAGAGAALIVDQADLTPDPFVRIALSLLRNSPCLLRMRAASLRLGRPQATRNVTRRLLNLLPKAPWHEPLPAVAGAAVDGG